MALWVGEGRVFVALGRWGGYLVLPTAARVQYVVSINGPLQCYEMAFDTGWPQSVSNYILAFYKKDKSLCAHGVCTCMLPRAQPCHPAIKLRTADFMLRMSVFSFPPIQFLPLNSGPGPLNSRKNRGQEMV